MKRALITGVTGQDGAYLARFLLDRGYEVHGTSRHPVGTNLANLRALGVLERLQIHPADMELFEETCRVLEQVQPAEVYHLAGPSSVGLSFGQPVGTVMSILQGTINLLEALRLHHPQVRFYHSASSEMFGGDQKRPYNEGDIFHPRSPYAVGKAAAYWTTVNYRESYGLHVCSGILFNHESPLRSEAFVTRKIATSVARIKQRKLRLLRLGGLSIVRDWGYAPEYVEAMWLMLQQDVPRYYVIATGRGHTLEEFVDQAFASAGLDWREFTRIDPSLFRPNEVRYSVGDPARANRDLGWQAKTTMTDLVHILVRHEMQLDQEGTDLYEDSRIAN